MVRLLQGCGKEKLKRKLVGFILVTNGRFGFDQRSRRRATISLNNLTWPYADKGKGNLDKATYHARAAIGITPEAGFFDTLGYAYYKKRQFEIAIEQFRKAIDRKPEERQLPPAPSASLTR